jgi:hypothetical protein
VTLVLLCWCVQVAVLLAPVAYVTNMDSLPMNALAALDTDEVRHALVDVEAALALLSSSAPPTHPPW